MTVMATSFGERLVNMFIDHHDLLLYGVRNTLILAIFGTIFGLLLALVLVVFRLGGFQVSSGWFRHLQKRVLKIATALYIGFFRGTPMMVQAMILYYGLQTAGVRIPVLMAGLVVVSLNTAAYLTEILKAGILSLDAGQSEAALSLGLTPGQTYRRVVFPQALRNMLPAIGNELVVNIKDTAVLSVIGVSELFFMGRRVGSASYRFTEAFVLVSILYLVLVNAAVFLLMRLTRHRKSSLPVSDSGVLV
ncbi:MAG: amino acid ABC transporter permease [Acholeplasmatales bacterium]|nr:MAG: amino acid ABC transporter permease [Acholeplasmatales bacterium]